MKELKDPTQNAMRHVVEPFLSQHGFQRTKERQYLRARSDFIDCISIGFSQWGSEGMYVYFSVHLALDPSINIHTYQFGDRLSINWYPKDREKALVAAETITREISRCALPWFEAIASIEQYEGAANRHLWDAALCALLRGEAHRALVYLGAGKTKSSSLPYSSGYPEQQLEAGNIQSREEKHAAFDGLKESLIEAVNAGNFESWAETHKHANYAKLGLC